LTLSSSVSQVTDYNQLLGNVFMCTISDVATNMQ